MITLYSMPSSGNSYKVRLLLAQLGIPFQHIAAEYDGDASLTKTDEFRTKNPVGKVPLIEFDDGRCLSESNAILTYFGEGTEFVPKDKITRAQMFQWMFFEQNMHEASVAVRRAVFVYPDRDMDRTPEKLAALLDSGNAALDVMEIQLQKSPYLAGEIYSLADIALFAYTNGCEIGGFDLSNRPCILDWLDRVKAQERYVPLEWLPE